MDSRRALSGRWSFAILIASVLALAAMVNFAVRTLGTNDVLMWEASMRIARSDQPLHLYEGKVSLTDDDGRHLGDQVFNHPPLIISVLRFWGWLSDLTGIRFRVLLRITSSLANLTSLLLIYLGVRRGCYDASGPALFALALSPACIFVAGFHGNTDPIMVCLLVASAYALDCRRSILLCGFFLGLATEIKVVPLLLIPALFFHLKSWRDRAICLAGFVVAAVPPAIPYFKGVPIIARNVLGYSSVPGHWGLTWWARRFDLPQSSAVEIKYLMYGVLIVASVLMNRGRLRISLFHQWGFLMAIVLAMIPGFGIQYLVWLSPWVVVLGSAGAITHYLAGGAFAFAVYTFWSRGWPWYFANAWTGDWGGLRMSALQQCAWLSVLLMVFLYWRSFQARATRKKLPV